MQIETDKRNQTVYNIVELNCKAKFIIIQFKDMSKKVGSPVSDPQNCVTGIAVNIIILCKHYAKTLIRLAVTVIRSTHTACINGAFFLSETSRAITIQG